MWHDGHIRSDWLPLGLTRIQAKRLSEAVFEVALPLIHEHDRQLSSSDLAPSVTSPIGWAARYGKGSTVKVRGCNRYRDEMSFQLRAKARELGLQEQQEASSH